MGGGGWLPRGPRLGADLFWSLSSWAWGWTTCSTRLLRVPPTSAFTQTTQLVFLLSANCPTQRPVVALFVFTLPSREP